MQLALTELIKQIFCGRFSCARVTLLALIVTRLIFRILEACHEMIHATGGLVLSCVGFLLLA